MHLSTCTLLFFLLTTAGCLQAQNDVMTQTTRDRINYNSLSVPTNSILYGFKGELGKLIGDTYLDTTWQAGNVKFYGRLTPSSDSLAGVPVRLDLGTNEVDIRVSATDIRAAKASTVRHVDMNTGFGVSRFINVREYRGDADALGGFFEQIMTGKLDLLLHTSIRLQRATYSPALNVGTKDDEYIKKMDWYVSQNKRATKFSPSRKAILELMADKKEPIEAFLKSEKPDLKSRSGLLVVVAYYNKL